MPQCVFGVFSSPREASLAKLSLREAGLSDRRIFEQWSAIMAAENLHAQAGKGGHPGTRYSEAIRGGHRVVAFQAHGKQEAATATSVMKRAGALNLEGGRDEGPRPRELISGNGGPKGASAVHSRTETPPPEKIVPKASDGHPQTASAAPGKQNLFRQILDLAKNTYAVFGEQRGASRGAAIAFYTVTSIAPILVIVIAVAGFVFGREAASGALFEQFRGLIGAEGADVLQKAIASASSPSGGIAATVISIITLILSASGVFLELEDALNAIWQAKAQKGVWSMARARIASVGLVIALGFLLIVSLAIDTALKALGGFLPFGAILLMIVSIVVSIGLMTVLIGAMFKFLPATPIAWRDVWKGAAVTAVLFELGKFLLGLYLGRSSTASSLGAAGALLALLFWVYYTAQIFLLGAAFTKFSAENPAAPKDETAGAAEIGADPVAGRPSARPIRPRASLNAIAGFLLVEAVMQRISGSRRSQRRRID